MQVKQLGHDVIKLKLKRGSAQHPLSKASVGIEIADV